MVLTLALEWLLTDQTAMPIVGSEAALGTERAALVLDRLREFAAAL